LLAYNNYDLIYYNWIWYRPPSKAEKWKKTIRTNFSGAEQLWVWLKLLSP